MAYVIFILTRVIQVLIIGLQAAMFLRAILSWFAIDEETPLGAILYCITEPVIMPVRALLDRFGWFEGLPIDMSFLFAYILLSIIGALL